jgi:hypothetical protein
MWEELAVKLESTAVRAVGVATKEVQIAEARQALVATTVVVGKLCKALAAENLVSKMVVSKHSIVYIVMRLCLWMLPAWVMEECRYWLKISGEGLSGQVPDLLVMCQGAQIACEAEAGGWECPDTVWVVMLESLPSRKRWLVSSVSTNCRKSLTFVSQAVDSRVDVVALG